MHPAICMYEPALKARSLEAYQGGDISFTERDGSPARRRLRRAYRHVSPTNGKHIHGTGGSAWFNCTLDGLLHGHNLSFLEWSGGIIGSTSSIARGTLPIIDRPQSHGRPYEFDTGFDGSAVHGGEGEV